MIDIYLTKTEKKIVILLVFVAIVNFIINIVISIIASRYTSTGAMETFISLWIIFGIINEILVVAALILMIRKE